MELREEKPDLSSVFRRNLSFTFFLKYGMLYGGRRCYGYTGEGSNRQRWITYRDADVYANVVQALHCILMVQRWVFICDLQVFGQLGWMQRYLDDIWSLCYCRMFRDCI